MRYVILKRDSSEILQRLESKKVRGPVGNYE